MRYIVAMTGSSGMPYGLRLLEALPSEKVLVMSDMAKRLLAHETGASLETVEAMADAVYQDGDLFAPIASGSYKFDAMVICPCSESTLGKIASGVADTLITRAAAVCMKEGRKLIIVPRETPLSTIHLRNMLALSETGCHIIPAMPAFYNHPKKLQDMIDFIAGRVLDALGVENDLSPRWGA
jgi:4-hydroxy-3-polyprenylbenzoate decarboxylase